MDWDERYRDAGRGWSGRPAPTLVDKASGLAPGRALDVGCGEGADAVWLAARGWQVVAVDLSVVALERGAERHAAGGASSLTITTQRDHAVLRLRRPHRV